MRQSSRQTQQLAQQTAAAPQVSHTAASQDATKRLPDLNKQLVRQLGAARQAICNLINFIYWYGSVGSVNLRQIYQGSGTPPPPHHRHLHSSNLPAAD